MDLPRRARSHVSTAACAIVVVAVAMAGCRGPSVEARAIWVESRGGEDERRVHVYDRGQLYDLLVPGSKTPTERVRLGPHGRSVLVRVGEAGDSIGGGAGWYDLEDGRRLPLWLPRWDADGTSPVSYTTRGDALYWTSDDAATLSLIPLAPGVELEFSEVGNVLPLEVERPGMAWIRSASAASTLLVAHQDGSASFLSYPDSARARGGLVLEARVDAGLPSSIADDIPRCTDDPTVCQSRASLDPTGQLALVRAGSANTWILVDQRAPALAGPIELHDTLAEAAGGGGLSLLRVLDRSVSAWIGASALLRWDRARDVVDSAPLFTGQYQWWFPIDEGRGIVFLSETGPMFRLDRERLEIINLETTDCQHVESTPVVSPSGAHAAWTCVDDTGFVGGSGVIVRVSRTGLERYVGVPMGVLALDDDGDLLVHSFESIIIDQVDGVAPPNRPRSLFVLTAEGVLSRVDDLEPAPVPVTNGVDALDMYMQGAALIE